MSPDARIRVVEGLELLTGNRCWIIEVTLLYWPWLASRTTFPKVFVFVFHRPVQAIHAESIPHEKTEVTEEGKWHHRPLTWVSASTQPDSGVLRKKAHALGNGQGPLEAPEAHAVSQRVVEERVLTGF
ncbi:hypothetical protein GCM10027034_37390 [Ramlibacter solisilvae]